MEELDGHGLVAGTCRRRTPRWVAVEPPGAEPGAHRPGRARARALPRAARSRVPSSASRTRVVAVAAWRVPVGRAARRSWVRPGTRLAEGNVQVGRENRPNRRSFAACPAHPLCQTTPNQDRRLQQRPPAPRQPDDGLRAWRERRVPAYPMPSEATTSPVPCGPSRSAASCIPVVKLTRASRTFNSLLVIVFLKKKI
ncbi:hypothetical protein PVAP13_6NG320001 [Panicum virgatum]|uniref:Uncharacterized protein n=1 Tax=Panicum virgatum TaxID=38727 RepID=A0A8T0R562_PANVG|nr:hypothetical protein PVAP13_6NG320001 [Panicum virgatum]